MELVLILTVGAAVLYGGWKVFIDLLRRARMNAFENIARIFNLKHRRDSSRRVVLHGVRKGFVLTIEETHGDGRLRITVDGRNRNEGAIPPSLTIRSVGLHGGPGRMSMGIDVPTGDDEFDGTFRVRGDPARVCSLLNGRTRRALMDIRLHNTLLVEEGRVMTWTPPVTSEDVLRSQIRETLGCARVLAESGPETAKRLAENVRSDPKPEVRLRNLEVMATDFPGHPDTVNALRAALHDTYPMIQLRAAVILGEERLEESFDILMGFIARFESHRGLAAHALSFLADRCPTERVLPLVKETFYGHSGPLRVAALRALGAVGDASAEGIAIGALDLDSDKARLAAAEALGKIGTAAAIAPLRAASRAKLLDFAFDRVVAEAVQNIQFRHPPRRLYPAAAEGQVALVEGEGPQGRLTLAGEREGGELALHRNRETLPEPHSESEASNFASDEGETGRACEREEE